MDDYIRNIFLRELETQLKCFQMAASEYNNGAKEWTAAQTVLQSPTAHTLSTADLHAASERSRQSQDYIWFCLQNMLVVAANISKILWGSGGKKDAERADLRTTIGVSDDSCLRDPDLRNDFEHFDSRLDAWYADGHSVYIGRAFGPPGGVTLGPDMKPLKRFHHFDPATGLVTFWDHEVSIPDLATEVETLYPAVHQLVAQPFS